MKYFTKYLPVEGEIRESDIGQLVRRENNTFKFQPNNILNHPQEYAKTKVELLNYKGYKVVKPFLCSRDIQVGDKYLTPPDFKERICEDNSYDFSNCFKVIGEISPDAIWVKEGDEFEENQIEGSHEINTPTRYLYNRDKILCYKIKCPTCGTFH